ncbi:leucine-rich repeat domain-containing protein, partial [Adlercreutzia sp. ZJ154]|uniref:leucine-rich repeat domain-containing protein n=1 Tax=Adlercreutzia sp. ZJ154 TaxID=2709790 RepID=UPI0013ECA6E1
MNKLGNCSVSARSLMHTIVLISIVVALLVGFVSAESIAYAVDTSGESAATATESNADDNSVENDANNAPNDNGANTTNSSSGQFINETRSIAAEAPAPAKNGSSAGTVDAAAATDEPAAANASGKIEYLNSSSEHIVAAAPIGSESTIVGDIEYAGLKYRINTDAADTVTLISTGAEMPESDMVIPSHVASANKLYTVTAIGNAAPANAAAGETTSPEVSTLHIPATIEQIDPAFFTNFPNLSAIEVDAESTKFASYNGMLFNADLTSLLSCPEGKEGIAALPDSLATVPAYVFTRCIKLSAISIGSAATSFTTRDGILYTNDFETLLAVPAGIGTTANIAPECTQIAEGAFAGNANLQTIIVNSNVEAISTEDKPVKVEGVLVNSEEKSAAAFSEDAIASANVALAGDYSRTAWEAAGFRNFTQPAKPGETAEASGLTYTLLSDYTLSVKWSAGDAGATAKGYIEIPAQAEVGGITYPVSAIADSAFANMTELTQVQLPETLTTIGKHAFEGTGLTSIYVPANVETIDNAAFANCAAMRSVNLNSALKEIGDEAFSGCAQTEYIALPASVQAIGAKAFSNNTNLKNIIALGSVESVDPTALVGVNGANIYVPYNESGEYAWSLGAPVANNHFMPYGVKIADEPFELAEGETANLFDGGYLEAPGDIEVSYSYKARPVSIDENGAVTAKVEGASTVEVSLSLNLGDAETVSQVQASGEDNSMNVLRAVRSVGASAGDSLTMDLGASTGAVRVMAAGAGASTRDAGFNLTVHSGVPCTLKYKKANNGSYSEEISVDITKDAPYVTGDTDFYQWAYWENTETHSKW